MSNLARNVSPIRPDLRVVESRVADTEDGFIMLAMALYEELIGANLTKNQAKVAHAICRKTYGFKKKMDRIADSQLAELCRISRPKANIAKNELIAMKVVLSEGNRIGPNKIISEWEIPESTLIGNIVTKKGTKNVTSAVTPDVTNPVTHKRNTLKIKEKNNTPVVPTEKITTPKEKNSTQISNSFKPNAKHQELANELGVNLQSEFIRFFDYNVAKGNKYKVWDSALNNWLRKAAEYRGNTPNRGVAQPAKPSNYIPEGFQ